MIAKYGKFEYVLAEHYRFEDELGRGAMGTVYRAKDIRLGRPVAIKMLHPMLTNELGIARFQSEIRIAAGLHHPNIVGVHDSGEADGRLFYVMDYLGGETLRARLQREKQLSVEDALGIVEHVAEGLQYAHDHGVVHRDIKPENIILAEGRAWVVDFGLARALGDVDTERLTASGLSVGTPHYLSPEQAAAEKEVGPQADQYGLACVLYDMLVGEPPFTGPTATSIAMRHISEDPRPLRLRRHTTPLGVEAAVMRALEKVPAVRFGSVREFTGALRRTDPVLPNAMTPPRTSLRTHLRRIVFGGMGLATFVGIAWQISRDKGTSTEAWRPWTRTVLDTSRYVIPPSRSSSRRIVVAAFTNQTGDRSLDPIGDLAADWLVRILLEAEFEVVDSRTSAIASRRIAGDTAAKTANDSAAALAARTGAATVVTGIYYRQGDTLQFEAKVVDPARGVILYAIGPVRGPQSTASSLLGVLANRVTATINASADSTAGARTASVVEPPSVAAFEHASRGWEMYFSAPADTSAVFAELARAAAIDTSYTTPLLMRAFVLDVNERWADVATAVKQLGPRRARMGRIERAVLALFESDLRGDLRGRLRASRELLRLSPGSIDMSLLAAISASYLNLSAEAYATLNASSSDRGINLVSPMYLAWHAVAEHTLGRFDDEVRSASELARRFPAQRYGALALARVHAARGDTSALNALLAKSGMNAAAPSAAARSIALVAARELRAHRGPREGAALFARVASISPRPDASRDERAKYGLALYEVGDLSRARAVFSSLLASNRNDVNVLGRLGTIAARSGDSATVQAIDQQLAGWRDAYAFGRPTYWRAHLAALSGRGSEAVALLNTAVLQGYRLMDLQIVTLHEDPDFASLWSDPTFRELARPRDGPAIIP